MANSYLSRTPGSTTDAQRKQFTISVWVKRSSLLTGSNHEEVLSAFATDQFGFRFQGDNKLDIFDYSVSGNNYPLRLVTNRLFRDTHAWYHIVLQVDTPNSTSSDRVKLWVNGVQETSFGTANYPSQDYTTSWNRDGLHQIGSKAWGNSGNGSDMFTGYLSHVANVAGSVVAPTVFGETDSTSGIWKFKPPSGVTWGTNGFHLKFENSGNLGLDSANSNNFTVNGNLKQSLSTPSNTYNTLNPIDSGYANATILNTSAGVTTLNTSGFGDYGVRTNLAVSKGKWYWECKNAAINGGGGNTMGLLKTSKRLVINLMSGSPVAGVYGIQRYSDSSINIHTNGSIASQNTAMFGGITTSDIIGFALDMDNGKLYISKNGSFKDSSGNTGNPATQAYPTFTGLSTGEFYSFYTEMRMNNDNGLQVNFGEGRFGTTDISSAGSNGNGSLFEYDVPSGFYALNTKNINTYG